MGIDTGLKVLGTATPLIAQKMGQNFALKNKALDNSLETQRILAEVEKAKNGKNKDGDKTEKDNDDKKPGKPFNPSGAPVKGRS